MRLGEARAGSVVSSFTQGTVVCFGLLSQGNEGGPGKVFKPPQQRLEFTMVRGRPFEERSRSGTKPYIDSLGLGLVGPLPVGAMAFSGIGVTSTAWLSAFHFPGQNRSLAKVLQLLQLLPEFGKTLSGG